MTAEETASLQPEEAAPDQPPALPEAELDALRTERDSLREQLNEARERWDSLNHRLLEDALIRAMTGRGVHPQAARLLLPHCEGAGLDGNGRLRDEDALMDSLRARWSGLFPETRSLGTGTVSPPVSGDRRVTREELRDMSPGDINTRWESIRDSLRS